MQLPIEDLESQALNLPADARARLVERLLASFDPPPSTQEAWLQEAQRRREEVQAGHVALVPSDEALARVRAQIG